MSDQKVFKDKCGECSMLLKDTGEYHPLSFCRLYQAGYSPWQLIADVMWEKGWEAKSVEILDRINVRDMNKRRSRSG